jgi:hypothetical protein
VKRIVRASAISLGLSLLMVAAAFAWEDRLAGQPSGYVPGASYGVFAWNDDAGLHLRLSTYATDYTGHTFSGTIKTDGAIVNFSSTAGPDDVVCVCPNARTITYTFHTGLDANSDGIDYGIAGGTYQTVAAYNNGGKMETYNIHLGANDAHPADNPWIDVRSGTP